MIVIFKTNIFINFFLLDIKPLIKEIIINKVKRVIAKIKTYLKIGNINIVIIIYND
jgi:hypothetical protein